MPGIYLHIPFCKKACHYCNFHFSTSLQNKDAMVEAILKELDLQRDYLALEPLSSIYFGGGTPSLLSIQDLDRIFTKISQLHRVLPDAEITLEANPDDLTPEKLRDLKQYTPVNRLSIGVQSFAEADLTWMNRAHNATHARACIENSLSAGFENLTVDLIYGAPTTSDEQWETNVQTVFDFGIPHISCYCLTVEEGTALSHFVKKGTAADVDDEKSARQFEWLMDAAVKRGYDHYEISNFAKPGWHAKHNTSYWLGTHYLGIGPSAHSFNGHSRQWNIANNAAYIRAIEKNGIPFDIETLSEADQYNEYVMTSLRTMWGCDLAKVRRINATFADHFAQKAQHYLQQGLLTKEGEHYFLTKQGKFLADGIASNLFF